MTLLAAVGILTQAAASLAAAPEPRLTTPDPGSPLQPAAPPAATTGRDLRRVLDNTTPQSIPRSPAGELLQSWIRAHNAATADALRHWLRSAMNPTVSDEEIEKRLGWYVEAVSQFGPLSQEPLAVLEDEPHRLVVHLVRSDMRARERLDPLNILVVELDVDADDPRYLARGLGLGSLACKAHEPDDVDPPEKKP